MCSNTKYLYPKNGGRKGSYTNEKSERDQVAWCGNVILPFLSSFFDLLMVIRLNALSQSGNWVNIRYVNNLSAVFNSTWLESRDGSQKD